MSIEAMKDALITLIFARGSIEDWGGYASEYFQNKHDLKGDIIKVDKAITTLRQAIEQAEKQEPVGTLNIWFYKGHGNYDFEYWGSLGEGTYAVYTTPHTVPAQLSEHIEDQMMRERDEYHEMADALAAKIEEITGTHIGEHSSANCPWRNALDAAENWLCHPAPPQREWVGLTEDEVIECTPTWGGTVEDVARLIEAKLKEKNT